MKYTLSNKGYTADGIDDDDSEFGSIDGDEYENDDAKGYESGDNQLNASDANLNIDTTKIDTFTY